MSQTDSPKERQRRSRRLILYPGVVQCGEARVDCEVVNISATGAKIRLEEIFECTSPISLQFDMCNFVGSVAWQNEEFVGIHFAEDPDWANRQIEEFYQRADVPAERRDLMRTLVMWAAEITHQDETYNCIVLNISTEGAKIRLYKRVNYISDVTLHIDRIGDLPGEVVWHRGEMIGIKFVEAPEINVARILPALSPAATDPHSNSDSE